MGDERQAQHSGASPVSLTWRPNPPLFTALHFKASTCLHTHQAFSQRSGSPCHPADWSAFPPPSLLFLKCPLSEAFPDHPA